MNQATAVQPAATVPASFAQRRVELPENCFRDIGASLLAADGSRYFLEWTPTLNSERRPRAALLQLCADCQLDGGGWDAPTALELATLVDHSQEGPATFAELADDTQSDWYVTKTVDPSSPSDSAVYVDFHLGSVVWYSQGSGGFVRAVRRVPASQ